MPSWLKSLKTWKPERKLFQKQFFLFYEEQQAVMASSVMFTIFTVDCWQNSTFYCGPFHSIHYRGNKWREGVRYERDMREILIINCQAHLPLLTHEPTDLISLDDSELEVRVIILIINSAQESCQQSSARPWVSPVASPNPYPTWNPSIHCEAAAWFTFLATIVFQISTVTIVSMPNWIFKTPF